MLEEYRGRVRIFVSVIVVLLTILGGRLAYMQLIDADAYTSESRNNAVREILVRPARGAIYDGKGLLMVDNRPTYTVQLTPRYFDKRPGGGRFDFDSSKVSLLASLLGVPDSTVWAKMGEAVRRNPDAPSPSFPETPFEAFGRVQENLFQLPGVTYEISQTRRYHTDARAAHVLGYIREIGPTVLERRYDDGYRRGDMMGVAGVERNYEMYLRGKLGTEWRLVNARGLDIGSHLDGVNDSDPISGYDLYLALDSDVQALAESLFVGKRGGAVAIDPRNGEIIAMVSHPDYDLDMFTRRLSREDLNYLNNSPEKPVFNRATQSMQPPGSTWKPFMSLMALQEGSINETSRISCGGGHPLGRGRFFRCMGVHGSIAVKEAIQRSCNTFFFELMHRTDVETFARYAHYFGFGQRQPTDVAEQTPGLIPDSSYFHRKFGNHWNLSWMNLGIGQGDMGTTPFELAQYMAVVANKGVRYPPHLIRELRHAETGEIIRPTLPAPFEVPIDDEYFDIVRDGMRLVMEAGTGRGVQIPGVSSGGKTGTAQAPGGRKDNSVFVMFAPYDDPKIAIAVQVENAGYGSTAAAPIASLMAELYLTGQILPERQALVQRVRSVRSEALPAPRG